MSSSSEYTPPKVWTWNKNHGGRFATINRPTAGSTHDKELPVGRHPMQLYSLGTPNGQKVTVMLEELLALGHSGAEYDAWLIRISEGDQFGSGFVAINPNSKIPALLDRSGPTPIRVFESDEQVSFLVRYPSAVWLYSLFTKPKLLLITAHNNGASIDTGGALNKAYKAKCDISE